MKKNIKRFIMSIMFVFVTVLTFNNLNLNPSAEEIDNYVELDGTVYVTKTGSKDISYTDFGSESLLFYEPNFVNGYSEIIIKDTYNDIIVFQKASYEMGDNHKFNIYGNGLAGLEIFVDQTLEKTYDNDVQTYYNIYYTDAELIEQEEPDTTVPVLNGETAFVTNVNDPMTVSEIKSHITAYDDVDGDLTSSIVVESDDYTLNSTKTGTYQLIFSVTDANGNKATLDVSVLVKDVDAPDVVGQANYTQSMTTLLDVQALINDMTVTDNYDDNTLLVINLKTDNYTDYYNTPGTHTVMYNSFDSSNNEGTFQVVITVIDDVAPSFSGATNIVKQSQEILSIADITAQLSATDNVDGDVTDNITIVDDNYTGNGNKVGTYTITYEVTDSSNNTTQKTVTVEVKDDIPPVFYVDNYFITVSESLSLTRDDIIQLFQATGQITVTTTTTITTLTNEYEGIETEVGMYALVYEVESNDGSREEISAVVNVIDDETDESVTLTPPVLTWYEVVWNWLETIANWFVQAWQWVVGLF